MCGGVLPERRERKRGFTFFWEPHLHLNFITRKLTPTLCPSTWCPGGTRGSAQDRLGGIFSCVFHPSLFLRKEVVSIICLKNNHRLAPLELELQAYVSARKGVWVLWKSSKGSWCRAFFLAPFAFFFFKV